MESLRNTIACGDCVKILGAVKKPFADLIFADPPFNIGYKYDKHKDSMKRPHYIEWTRQWMAACKHVLKPDGSFYVAIGDDYAANVKIIADELGLHLRNWIIWHYTFGQQTKDKFARAHTHILYFVNNPRSYTFNAHSIRVPSDRQLLYADLRANPAGKIPDDVWDEFSRVCGTFKERVGWHPCQMPERLIGRIICTSSKSGGRVLDPFMGSGTTAAAAIRFGRTYTGIEISEAYAKKTRQRLKQLQQESKMRHRDGFDWLERNELDRLFWESPVPIADVLADDHTMEIYARQFALRMNNGMAYKTDSIRRFFNRLMSESAMGNTKAPKLRTRRGEAGQKNKAAELMLFG
ncbi:MAG TPA: site-specific DNA-methyltransferase [Sedimentisphaerales bacterium]|nr:site-specific DNA-methyltransferase [Sedimentisphaerales bacterium]